MGRRKREAADPEFDLAIQASLESASAAETRENAMQAFKEPDEHSAGISSSTQNCTNYDKAAGLFRVHTHAEQTGGLG